MSGPSRLAVLCVYQDGVLPAAWFQVVRRLRAQIARAGLDVDVRLAALSAVAPGAAVVVAPPALVEAAAAAARAAVVAVPLKGSAPLDEVIARLEQASPSRVGAGRRTVVRRGFRVLSPC